MFGEHELQVRAAERSDTSVHERRVLMAMNDGGSMAFSELRDAIAERGTKSHVAMQGDHFDAAVGHFRSESARAVEATDRHPEPLLQLSTELDDEALGSARIEAEHDLQDAGCGHADFPNSEPNAAGRCTTGRSEEHTSELQSRSDLVCRLLLEKKKHNARHKHSSDVPVDAA